jgi:hypothetical protein
MRWQRASSGSTFVPAAEDEAEAEADDDYRMEDESVLEKLSLVTYPRAKP